MRTFYDVIKRVFSNLRIVVELVGGFQRHLQVPRGAKEAAAGQSTGLQGHPIPPQPRLCFHLYCLMVPGPALFQPGYEEVHDDP